jgi:hypothetical protein
MQYSKTPMFTRLARWPGPSCGSAGQGWFGAGPALTGGMYAPLGPASRTTVANHSRQRRTRDKVPAAIKLDRGAYAAQTGGEEHEGFRDDAGRGAGSEGR